MTPFSRHLAAAAACAALALPVWAQGPSPAAPQAAPNASSVAPSATPHAERQAKRQQWQEKRTARHAERLTELKQKLAITPAQEPAWTRFAAAMQPQPGAQRLPRADIEKLSTPERIDRLRELRTQRNAAMDARLDATKAFYAQLQPEQQRSFDTLSARMFKGGERHGKHRHGRHMQGGPAA